LVIVKPETLIGWHRKGFKLFWKEKSQAGRPLCLPKIQSRANAFEISDIQED
jgi:hypothetical protein